MRRIRLFAAITIVAAALSSLHADAQGIRGTLRGRSAESKHIQDRTYHFDAAGKDMPYSLYVPTTYSGSANFPLIVALHGLGSSAAQIIRYRGFTDLAEQHGYIIVAPEGYNNHGWYGSLGPGTNRFSERFAGPEGDPANLGELSEQDVFNVLGIVQKEFRINPKRVYLLGHSMGGGGTLYLGMKHKELWAGLAPIAPAIYSRPAQLSAISTMPIILVQGDADRLVHVEVTRQWANEMKTLGMPYQYIEVPGGNHVNVAMDKLPDIFAFFDQHASHSGANAD